MEWQTIDTAPKDVFIITMFLNEYGEVNNIQKGQYFSDIDQWVLAYGNSRTPNPTHWMPLPPAPIEEK